MDRLAGGIGGRGPGETKLETDRRRLRDRVARIKDELKTLRQTAPPPACPAAPPAGRPSR